MALSKADYEKAVGRALTDAEYMSLATATNGATPATAADGAATTAGWQTHNAAVQTSAGLGRVAVANKVAEDEGWKAHNAAAAKAASVGPQPGPFAAGMTNTSNFGAQQSTPTTMGQTLPQPVEAGFAPGPQSGMANTPSFGAPSYATNDLDNGRRMPEPVVYAPPIPLPTGVVTAAELAKMRRSG